MQELKDILYGVKIIGVKGNTDVRVDNLTFDSKNVSSKSVFFAIQGVRHDGHDYVQQVIDAGCKVIIISKQVQTTDKCTVIQVDNTKKALSIVSSNFFGEPSKKLKLIGITGTNGKTTISTLLYNLYTGLGYQTGLISTVVNKISGLEIPATHTTPDSIQLNSILNDMVEAGCSHCFMEVSSHAIHQHRSFSYVSFRYFN